MANVTEHVLKLAGGVAVNACETDCHSRLLVLSEITQSQRTSQHPKPSAKIPSTPPRPICLVHAQHEFHCRPPGGFYIVATLWPVFLQRQPRKLTKILLIFWFRWRTSQTLQNDAPNITKWGWGLGKRDPAPFKSRAWDFQNRVQGLPKRYF